MIKVIAFDLVGVLVSEKDIELSEIENKLERMFGPNINDDDYLTDAKKLIKDDLVIIKTTEKLIDKLYKIKDKKIFEKLKEKHPKVKMVIATNHLSFVRKFISKSFNNNYLDDLIISAEIHKIKPNIDFYQYLLKKYKIKPEELLFIDDNKDNIETAKKLGIFTIKVDKNMDIFKEVNLFFNNITQ